MIVVVVLMGTIYMGIMMSLQKTLLRMPDVMVRQLLSKEAEAVSDYALRTAVRNSVTLGLQASEGSILKVSEVFDNFQIGNCVIDSIQYAFVESGNHYRAITHVRGTSLGQTIHYPAEIAFNFPISQVVGNPDCFYLEMDQPQFNPAFNRVYDSSEHGNDGFFHGAISTRPNGSGVNGWKCASFESSGGWIDFPGNASTEVSGNFSMVCFAKIRQGQSVATLLWLPSDPYDTTVSTGVHPGQDLRYKPTGGIWYQGGNLHFSSVNTAYTQTTITVPFTPDGKWPHNKDKWHFFALTYNNGILKAYVNGVLKGTAYQATLPAIPSTYGFTLGRKDIRNLGSGGTSEYMYMYGLMDQVGLYNRTLSDAEIFNFYNGVINPAEILYIKD